MDAKVGDWVVTPRQGQAVEINALWYNALKIISAFATLLNEPDDQEEYNTLAEQVREAFRQTFWNPDTGCLFDCIDGDRRDAAIRPNQLFAISLPFPLLTPEQGQSVLAVVEEKLVTPVGLRSLAPDDPAYRGWYGGDQVSRDGAYHQGTVWSWLAGPYLDACLNLYSPEEARQKAQPLLDGLRAHLGAAGIGSVSEVFDGDAPHTPRGCTAQAWGVAEFLRLRSFMRRF
jgi:predicted glycogen debranching enzyme